MSDVHVTNADCVGLASNCWMTVNNKVGRKLKEAVLACHNEVCFKNQGGPWQIMWSVLGSNMAVRTFYVIYGNTFSATISGSLSAQYGASSGCGWTGLPMWRTAINGWSSSLRVERGANNSSPKKKGVFAMKRIHFCLSLYI